MTLRSPAIRFCVSCWESRTRCVHVADTGNTNLEYVDTNVDPEITYVYRVKAINPTGVGPQSNFIRIKTAPAP